MKKNLLFIISLLCCSFIWAQDSVNDTIMATNNGYINEGAPTTKLIQSVWNMEVRTTTKYTRWGYVQIPLEKIVLDAQKTEFKIYLTGEKLATKNGDGTLNVNSYTSDDLEGKGLKLSLNLLNYTFDNNMTWDLRTMPDGTNEIHLGDVEVDNTHKDTYLVWDVSEVVKARKAAGDTHIYLRMESKDAPEMLRLRQVKISTGETGSYFPRLIQARAGGVGISDTKIDKLTIYPTIVTSCITITEGSRALVYNMHGQLMMDKAIVGGILDVSGLDKGFYILKNDRGSIARFIKE